MISGPQKGPTMLSSSLPSWPTYFLPPYYAFQKQGKKPGTGSPLLITTNLLSCFLPSHLMVSRILTTKTKITTANNSKSHCSQNRGAPWHFFCTELPEAVYCKLRYAVSSKDDMLPGCPALSERELRSHGPLSKAFSLDHASLAAKLWSTWINEDHRKVAFKTIVAQNSSSPYYKTELTVLIIRLIMWPTGMMSPHYWDWS